MKDQISTKIILLSILVIVTAGFVVYGNSIKGEFIGDDYNIVRGSSTIKSWDNIPYVFKKNILPSLKGRGRFYRSIPKITYMMDYSLWGLNVEGYHLTNILLHILAALSIFWMVNVVFKKPALSLLTSLLFIVHPVQCEAVAYISGRNDSLIVLFMLLAFIFYVKHIESKRLSFYLLMALSYILAIMSKENAMIFPALLLVYHLTSRRKINYKAFVTVSIIAFAYFVTKIGLIQSNVMGVGGGRSVTSTAFQRIPGFFAAITSYFRMMVVPFDLHMDYGQKLFSLFDPKVMLGMGLTAGLLFYALRVRKQRPLIFFGTFWFFLALLPVSNILHLFSYMADHFLYLPSIGFFLILAGILCRLYEIERFKISAIILITGLLIFYSCLTIKQNEYWRDAVGFYKRTLKHNPNSVFAYVPLGGLYYKMGKKDKAEELFIKTIQIKPDYAEAYYNLGIISNDRGKKDEAMKYYETATRYEPDYEDAYNNMAVIYIDRGKTDEAIRLYKKVIKIKPYNASGYYNLGFAYHVTGRTEDAMGAYAKAVEINPNYAEALNNIGAIYHTAGNRPEAMVFYEKAIQADPSNVNTYKNRAILYYDIKKYDEAWGDVNKVKALGGSISPGFISNLEKASGKQD